MMNIVTFRVMVPTKPALTVTGRFKEFSASAFNFKSLRTTSPVERKKFCKKDGIMFTSQITSIRNRHLTVVAQTDGKNDQ